MAAPSNMRVHFAFLVLMAAFLGGCMHTHIGGGLGRTSPDGKYELQIASDGANGKSYVDKTKKKIWIRISDGNTLFEHAYALIGSDVEWRVNWSSLEAVSVELYDWGDGVSNYENMKHMAASNQLALLSFVLDKNTGKFKEQR